MGLLVIMVKKYTIKEFESYGSAGKVAQEVLSSIRTVYAFGLQKKKVQLYDENLKIAEAMSIKKGNVFGVSFSLVFLLSVSCKFFSFFSSLVV